MRQGLSVFLYTRGTKIKKKKQFQTFTIMFTIGYCTKWYNFLTFSPLNLLVKRWLKYVRVFNDFLKVKLSYCCDYKASRYLIYLNLDGPMFHAL